MGSFTNLTTKQTDKSVKAKESMQELSEETKKRFAEFVLALDKLSKEKGFSEAQIVDYTNQFWEKETDLLIEKSIKQELL